MNLIICGPQGSGKGTQAELLAKKFGLAHLEMGDLLREVAKKKTKLGKKIDNWLNKGVLIPNRIIMRLSRSFMTKAKLKKGIIFDGFPRILSQVYLLEKELAKRGSRIDKFIYLWISRKESLRRLGGRRVCPKCNRNFNLITIPPKKDELCDDCQVKLITREDETREAILRRLANFRRSTLPVVEYYKKKGIVIEVNGEAPVVKIHKGILRVLASQDEVLQG